MLAPAPAALARAIAAALSAELRSTSYFLGAWVAAAIGRAAVGLRGVLRGRAQQWLCYPCHLWVSSVMAVRPDKTRVSYSYPGESLGRLVPRGVSSHLYSLRFRRDGVPLSQPCTHAHEVGCSGPAAARLSVHEMWPIGTGLVPSCACAARC